MMKRLIRTICNGIHNAIKAAGVRRILIILIGACLAGYLMACMLAPTHRINQLNREYGPASGDQTDRKDLIGEYPEISQLVRQKAYLQSRIIMEGTDSIGLIINLRDSIVALEIEGITIHTARISGFRIDRFFLALENSTYAAIFSQPLMVEHHKGSFVKEPVYIQKAPRDTAEALNSVFVPDTLQNITEYVTFSLDHGLRLFLEEDEKGSFGKQYRKSCHYIAIRGRQAGKNIWSVLQLKVPGYEPSISISLPGKDIISIYRALPEKALVAILIP